GENIYYSVCFTVFYYIFLLQHSGKPIHCWTPQEFTRSWEEYAENYCWVASTYFVHLNSYLGPSPPQMFYHRGSISSSGYLIPIGQRQASQASINLALAHPQAGEQPPAGRLISYYQWAPILLAIQSFLFYLPCLVWRLFASQSGFQHERNHLRDNECCIHMAWFDPSVLQAFIFCDLLDNPRTSEHNKTTAITPPHVILAVYLCVQYNFYGIRVLYDLARGRQWEESGHFPRVTFCDFEARKLAQSHYYTLQCVLPINMFLEKIYIFLWLWFFLVGLITLVSIIVWISRIGTRHCRFAWIRHQLITIRQYNRSVHCCKQFVENHLGPDGVFILRLIAQNYGDLVAGDAVGELWNAYWQKRTGGTGDKTGSDKGQDLGFTEYSRQTSGQAVKPPGSLRVRPSSRSRQTLTATPLTGDSSIHTLSHKEQRRKHLLQTGYSATMMATEMIHPSDRFAVPLLTSTRKPPSLHSHDSSRYSRDSRDRDRSESPPPIPQRSSDGGEYSLSDRRSVQNFGGRSDSQSSSVNRPLTSTREDDTGAREYAMESEQHIASHRESDVDREVRDAFGVDRLTDDDRDYVYKDTYVEEYQPDDNIV
ncbi:Innexin, partial [Paragonimus heterotremus]